jgi:hypothetical protein
MHARWRGRLDDSTIDALIGYQRCVWLMWAISVVGTVLTIVADEARRGDGGLVFPLVVVGLVGVAWRGIALGRRAQRETAQRYGVDPRLARKISYRGLDGFDRRIALLQASAPPPPRRQR